MKFIFKIIIAKYENFSFEMEIKLFRLRISEKQE
jgi:hypothetical protein